MSSLNYDVKPHLPTPKGPYNVGCVDLSSPLQHDSNTRLVFRLFYPTSEASNPSKWIKWLPHPQYSVGYMARVLKNWKVPLMGRLFTWFISDPFVPIIENGSMSTEKNWPLIIFSHGIGSCRSTYSRLCSEIASVGYVVAAPEHQDGSANISLSLVNGKEKWIPSNALPTHEKYYDSWNAQVSKRQNEIKDLIIYLRESENKILTSLSGSFSFVLHPLESRRSIYIGHSFGGATILSFLASESSSIGIALDPWLFPISRHLPHILHSHLLFINYEDFQWKSNLDAMASFTTSPNILTLKKANHYCPSDIPTIFSNRILYSMAPQETSFELTLTLLLSFLAKELNLQEETQRDFRQILKDSDEKIFFGTEYYNNIIKQ